MIEKFNGIIYLIVFIDTGEPTLWLYFFDDVHPIGLYGRFRASIPIGQP